MKPDMYVEKFLQVKYYKGNLNSMKTLGIEVGCAEDVTAN